MKFRPLKTRFRATFSAGGVTEPRLGQIDRENEILHDVQITLEGEALGHGVWLDRAFCEACAAAGNEMGDAGVKVRFGHPAMCSDALGTYLGRAKNFRVVDLTRKDGTQAAGVIADVHLAAEAHKAPSGDLAAWVLDTATNSPDTFGQSIVFTYADWKVKDSDGNDHSYNEEVTTPFAEWMEANPDAGEGEIRRKDSELYSAWLNRSADGRVYAVLGKLHGTDFTDTPAATDGVFSAGDLAARAEDMLDEHPEVRSAIEGNPDAVFQFLSRVGIIDKLESKRVSGIQSKMNHALDDQKKKAQNDLSALQAQFEESIAVKDARLTELSTSFAEERARFEKTIADLTAAKNEFETQLKDANEKLATATAEGSRLSAELTTTREELAHTGEQLSGAKNRLAMLGHEVNRTPEEDAISLEVMLSNLPMSQREAFYKAHAKEFKKIK